MGNSSDGSALITMVDRASKYAMIGLVSSKKADEVRPEIINMMLPIKEKILTMTYDNGREFAHHQSISGSLKADTYFAKLYHSWERGLNEHTNGLIRQSSLILVQILHLMHFEPEWAYFDNLI